MRVRALDSNGDWTFGGGLSNYKTGILAVAQNLQTRLNMYLGDCFFDTQAGIDWFNLLGQKSELSIQLAVSATILNTAYVTGIVSLSSAINADRSLTLTYAVTTSFGPVTGTTTVSPPNYLLTQGGDILQTQSGEDIIL